MGGKVIGHRVTIIQQSIEIAGRQFLHITRSTMHALHSTKGWRKIKSDKTIEKFDKPKTTKMHIFQQYQKI